MMRNKRSVGSQFENMAVKYLWSLGYKLLERNHYTKYGEIDIVVESQDEIVFCEVRGVLKNMNYQK